MRDYYLTFADATDRLARAIVIVLMAVMCVVVLAGVFWRYVLNDALTWTEEAGRYLMIWMGFLGVAPALREGGHVAVDVLLNRLAGSSRRAVILFVRLLCVAFLATVVAAAFLLIPRISGQITPVLGVSTAWPYLAIPVGSLLTIIEMGALMIRDPDPPPQDIENEAAMAVRS
jgi:TRAP-type C4-dicarboxylate transport system permease small subunit